MATNISALHMHSPEHPVLERYARIGKLLSGDTAATVETGIQWVRNFCLHAKISPLSSFGFTEIQFKIIIEKALQASSMKGNPITLNGDDLRNILQMSL
jgi:alcohol dehydrogenase class IV